MAMALISELLETIKLSRTRTPTIIQMEAVECGAASLGIILAYYKCIVPLPELRQACGVSRDGSKASNVRKTAQRYGLLAKGFCMPVDELQDARLPCIVFWNFNHFVVIEAFGSKSVYINDPASGRRKVSYEEFNTAYTGVVLLMEPGPDFKTGGKKRGVLPALISRLKHSKRAVIFALLTGLLLTLPQLAVPAFSQVFIDEILVEQRDQWLKPLILGICFTSMVQGILTWMRLTYLRQLQAKLVATMAGQFVWHILRLPSRFYAQRYAGEITNRIELNTGVADVVTGQLGTTVIDTLMIGIFGLIMFFYDWVLTLMTMSFAAANLVVLWLVADARKEANAKLAQDQGKFFGNVIAALANIESVKASGLEGDIFARFSGYYTKVLNARKEAVFPNLMLSALPEFLTALSVMAILVVGGIRVMYGELSIGMLVAFQALSQQFLGPVNTLMGFGSTLQNLEADLDRLDDVLQNEIDPEIKYFVQDTDSQSPASFASFQLQGHLEIRNLTFGYSPLQPPLIENFSVTVQPGQRVAMMGSSGSGKSTIARLVAGIYQSENGDILLDGQVRSQLPRSVIANSIAMVEQEIFLFAGTIRDNLTLWDPTVPFSNLVHACQDAAIHDLILSLPGGYESELIDGGMNLSGGQRQRLEIARALVRNPALLILDEATSALDAETEQIIDRNFRRRGCTCLIVAHRLSTIRDCDEIIVLDRGKVVQRGTHESMRQESGPYRALIDS